MTEIKFKQIGTIHSQNKEPEGTPIQSSAANGIKGTVDVFSEYAAGLEDLDGFSHIMLIYCFHLSRDSALKVMPFLDDRSRGIFATRAPNRPNPIGVSIVRINNIDGNKLSIEDVDILDGSPLLDIKPFVAGFDNRTNCKIGWLKNKIDSLADKADDGRFKRIDNYKI